ncbi:nucleotidyl transferase AbiEii/AbiGii toxin family protein [Eggerthella sinensis]|uniref:nucleotidyl transferase AbiEii/AbiGii toxin family protein n=1 Tax=Eggerthella sinensis TaxID=242230 RepID=UPI0022E98AF6|nr:nucleotidyl transferase AbiEii/AbiGii toxin family protein [Eggerthella sinensis]
MKDLIRNKAKGDSSRSQALLRHYAMERFLERLANSPYRDNFVLKGGMLMSSLVGVDQRSTMDIDATVKGLTLDTGNASRSWRRSPPSSSTTAWSSRSAARERSWRTPSTAA